MKIFQNLFIGLSFLYLLSSCQDVIQLDLNDIPPRLVIEGVITDQPGPYYVKISESARFYDSNIFPSVSGATVTISDNEGDSETLLEDSPGVYKTTDIQGVRGRTYTLEVNLDGETYTAESTIPNQQILLDSIGVEFKEESFFENEGYYFTIFFQDPPVTKNYYRLLVYVNGAPFIFNRDDEDEGNWQEDNNLWLQDDKFTDGNVQDLELPHNLKLGDSLSLELLHLDRSTYDYYRTLNDVIESQGVAPSNPLSNFKESALGYFGAYSVTKNNIVIEE